MRASGPTEQRWLYLLQEVMLDLPDVVEADAIGKLDLLEGVLEQPVLGTLHLPADAGCGLVKDSEFHASILSSSGWERRCSSRGARQGYLRCSPAPPERPVAPWRASA